MRRKSLMVFGLLVALNNPAEGLLEAIQLPLAPVHASGQTVTPVFEGWYQNPDGTYSLSFGYFNRNSEEVVEIPIGANNFMTPGELNQGQPTRFHPRRHWGVFAVTVPADFGTSRLTWALKIRGKTFSIPGSLHREWEIDALEGEAGAGNTPPVLKFDPSGPKGRGPGGITAPPLTASRGKPLTLTVWATDDGRPSTSVFEVDDTPIPVTLAWFKHQGPGDVGFDQPLVQVSEPDGKVTTTVTFKETGEYILRVRATDASGVANAGHAQCCWTNGFVKVTVTP